MQAVPPPIPEENPYRPPLSELLAARESRQPRTLASRWRRLGGSLLDNLALVPGFALLVYADKLGETDANTSLGIGLLGCLLLLGVVVANLVGIARFGQTIGKMLLAMRVVRTNGDDVSLGRYIGLRVVPLMIAAMIPGVGKAVGLIDSLVIFQASRKCLHDEIADTIVVMT